MQPFKCYNNNNQLLSYCYCGVNAYVFSVDTAIKRVQKRLPNHSLRHVVSLSVPVFTLRHAKSDPLLLGHSQQLSWGKMQKHIVHQIETAEQQQQQQQQQDETFLTGAQDDDDDNDDAVSDDLTINSEDEVDSFLDKARLGTGGDYQNVSHVDDGNDDAWQGEQDTGNGMVVKTLSATQLLRLQCKYPKVYTSR